MARKTYRTRDQARADVFDYIERFYNPRRRHSTIGYFSPMEFEQQAISLGWCLPNRQQLKPSVRTISRSIVLRRHVLDDVIQHLTNLVERRLLGHGGSVATWDCVSFRP